MSLLHCNVRNTVVRMTPTIALLHDSVKNMVARMITTVA